MVHPIRRLNPRVQEASERVQKACEENGVAFLGGGTADNIAERLDSGIRVVSGGNPEIAAIGRTHTKRTMAV